MRGVGLAADEREVISRELAQDKWYRDIGRLLARNHTVISREVNTNGGRSAHESALTLPASWPQPLMSRMEPTR